MIYDIRRYRADCKYRTEVSRLIRIRYFILTMHSILYVMKVQRERKLFATKSLYELALFFIASIHIVAYLYLQPIILNYHLISFVFYAGLLNVYFVDRMIVTYLTKDLEFLMYNVLTFPLGLIVIDSLRPTLGLWPSALGFGTYQIAFVFMLMGLSIDVYGSFVVSLSVQATNHNADDS